MCITGKTRTLNCRCLIQPPATADANRTPSKNPADAVVPRLKNHQDVLA